MGSVMCLLCTQIIKKIFWWRKIIRTKNLDCWNYPNTLILKNRRGGCLKNGKKNSTFVPKVYKNKKLRQLFFSTCPEQKLKSFLFGTIFLILRSFWEKSEKPFFHQPPPPNRVKKQHFRQTNQSIWFPHSKKENEVNCGSPTEAFLGFWAGNDYLKTKVRFLSISLILSVSKIVDVYKFCSKNRVGKKRGRVM